LKILHFRLEPQTKEEEISFIGLSNWSLDASKMNRGITLCRPPLEKSELKKTAIKIFG
jgi:hypothetical protein